MRRTIGIVIMVWLLIGVLAGQQRHYYSGNTQNCASTATIAVTIIAGPLNYLGANPKATCKVPQPSALASARPELPRFGEAGPGFAASVPVGGLIGAVRSHPTSKGEP